MAVHVPSASSSRNPSTSWEAACLPYIQKHLRSVYRKQFLSALLWPDLEWRFLCLGFVAVWRQHFNKSPWLTLHLRTSYLSLPSTNSDSYLEPPYCGQSGVGLQLFFTCIEPTTQVGVKSSLAARIRIKLQLTHTGHVVRGLFKCLPQ